MSRVATLLLSLLLFTLVPGPAFGWNAGGHRLVAAIAWNELAAGDRAAIVALLDAHPDAGRWERRAKAGDDRGFVLFTESSTWADDIRRDRRFFDEGVEPETPSLDGFPDMARHRSWHYLNLPVDGPPRAESSSGDLDRRIRRLAETLAARDEAATQRAYALVWLIHLVGDLHQPLHVATRRHADGSDDAGGNGLPVFDPGNRRFSDTNLHAWWDDLPGPPWLRGSRLRAAADAVRRAVPARTAPASIERWRDESHRLAREVAYAGVGTELTIDDDYRQRARRVAGERVALAGIRLGRLLAELLAVPTGPRPERDGGK